MLQGWLVLAIALVYIGMLFAVAHYGDRNAERWSSVSGRPLIYALTLGVYCTSWTFFGSVGLAATKGFDFLTIYVGPIVLFTIGFPIFRRVVKLAKSERITSIADFIAARYGKSQPLAAVVTLIAFVGIVPYIALQLKAVSQSVSTLVAHLDFGIGPAPFHPDVPLTVAMSMAAFACLFGTRQIDATEHQTGLMLAVATESVVKLVTLSAVGLYVLFVLFDGPSDLYAAVEANPISAPMFTRGLSGGNWIVMSLLSFFAVLLLPRMFHVAVVENRTATEIGVARWLFPAYLVAINLFVVPLAMAGMVRYGTAIDADTYVLRLPLDAGADLITVTAFIGGLSSATAMVIVASVALAVMVCNEVVAPILVRRAGRDGEEEPNMVRQLLMARRIAILVILMLAYAYHRAVADASALADIGLLAFAAIAQFAPAFFGALFWRRGTARGAIAGILAGFAVWCYTLALPTFVEAGYGSSSLLLHGPFGLWVLRPQALFSLAFDPLAHGVFWSLLANVVVFVSVSMTRAPEPIERLQANVFVPSEFTPTPALRRWRTAVTVDDLISTVARYLGEDRTNRAFADFGRTHTLPLVGDRQADLHLLRFAEQLLASAIGAASSRLVLSLLVKRRDPSTKAAIKLLDDASAAIQYNRDLLQIALDQVGQGISVFDRELGLICWNRQFRQILDLGPEFAQVGVSLQAIVRDRAERGEFGSGNPERIIRDRLDRLVRRMETYHERLASTDAVIEVRTSPMPDGGIVTTWTDITERVASAEALARANETLERRVRERTEELTRLNSELSRAKAEADEANIGKTKFLAAAGHDILQPLNAARLYATSLVEKTEGGPLATHAVNIDQSLDAVEEILGALLDISRLDTGALKPEFGVFRIDEILKQLKLEFEPIARDRGLDFRVLPSSLWVRSDRRLLRRLVQNLVSNAIKYTQHGRVVVGCRRKRGRLTVDVLDTGLGIPESKQKIIFLEFQRLDQGAKIARGLGLGLSIVERIGRVLSHPIGVKSAPHQGSHFWVDVPTAAPIPETATVEGQPRLSAARFDGMSVLCLDNEEKILDGMEALLVGWGAEVVKAHDQKEASAILSQRVKERGHGVDLLFVDYHLDDGNGIDAVVQLRWRFGSELQAALITADRSPQVREAAAEKSISVLNKPVKPAALRAVLAQCRAAKAAAAE
ncbi:response regulator [Siculibacillus lacustris]|uniref:histidine kinase n=1 Tax=Siculibacillus lacustris TaxID=1549641 RepID=A0A4Q9VNE4_9HYPH|nr:NahK/ErcS family hybrid sensor histidine kinase/response regulator [Siculibacillus lacustris]TBW37165.1 response regulator [Siculibacillus lacustris]